MWLFLLITGIMSLLYYCGVALMAGHGTNFYHIWLIIGVILIVWALLWKRGFISKLPKWFRKFTLGCVIAGGALFLLVEGMIISRCFEKGKDGLDYVIVLGAYLRPEGPSTVLEYRLEKAYEYYCNNPDVMIIVSGGQGPNEHKPEAEGMAEYLVEKGVSQEQILIENTSTSTAENLKFSSQFIDEENASVGIITNNFHVFRATQIARKAGYKEVYGIAARSYPLLQAQNMLREFFGVVKDFIFGNM